MDHVFGDCEKACEDRGILNDYIFLQKNPDYLETDDFREFSWNTVKDYQFLAENFEPYEGAAELIHHLNKKGYQFCFSTNNMLASLPQNQKIFRERFSHNGIKPDIEFHVTKIIKPENGKPKIVHNGSKKDYAARKFKTAERGIHISDDRNELEAASYVEKLKNEDFQDILNIKIGDDDIGMYSGMDIVYKEKISDIMKDKELLRKLC